MYQLKKFSRCCYYFMKELVEFHGSTEVLHIFYLDIVFLVYAIFYYLNMSILGFAEYRLEFLFSICTKDPVCLYIYHHQEQYEPFFPLMIFLMELFNFYCQTKLVFLNTDTPTWRWWDQLIVQHQDFYSLAKLSNGSKLDKAIAEAKREALSSSSVLFQLLKIITPQIIFEKCILPVFIKADLFRSLKTINRPLFYRQQLSTLPHISSGLRRRLLLFKLSADKLFFVFQAFIIFIVLAVYFVYFYSIISQFSKPPILSYYIIVASVLYTFTVAVIYYCLMRMLRCALFFIYCSLLGTLVYTGHLTEIGDRVNRLLQAYSFQTGSFSGYGSLMVFPVTYRPLFTLYFLHDHNLICSLVLTGSRDLFGDILFVFLLTNM